MELFTRNHDSSWDRIVHIYVDSCEGISQYINDKDTYKILLVDEGNISIESGDLNKIISAPAIVMLTDEAIKYSVGNAVTTTTVYLKTTEIREEFTPERINVGEFENEYGKTIYQDYLLVKSFEKDDKKNCKVLPLGLSAYTKIQKTVRLMNNELTLQNDDFWPCRSRSYMMELLYFISYVCSSVTSNVNSDAATAETTGTIATSMYSEVNNTVSNATVSKILQYLSEHIGDRITLEDIMKEFAINRNRLNELFMKETSMTCLNYLVKMRINLAQIMLSETELQIAEIADRVGYPDANYFIKVFKKNTGFTPSQYRKN